MEERNCATSGCAEMGDRIEPLQQEDSRFRTISRLYREEKQYEFQSSRLLSEIYIQETEVGRVHATTKDGIDDDETVQENLWITRRNNCVCGRFPTKATSEVQRTHQGEGIPILIPTAWIQGLSC